MSEQSAKPYLIRALYEWCVDQGYTPYLAVRVNSQTRVPQAFVKNGEIVLNVGPLATHKLTMDNEWVLFNARFNGVSQEVAVPFSAVVGLFAKETGYGMGFQPEAVGLEDASIEAPTVVRDSGADDLPPDNPSGGGASVVRPKSSHLKVVK